MEALTSTFWKRGRALVAGALSCAFLFSPALAATGENAAPRGGAAAPAAPAASAVVGAPQFNSWLVSLNGELGLPARDLAAISYRAHQVLGAEPAATARWNSAAREIELVPARSELATEKISLQNLSQLREVVSGAGGHAQAWMSRVAGVKDPQALARALDGLFDRSADAPSAEIDPLGRTVAALAAKLPPHLRKFSDLEESVHQRSALEAWQRSARKTYVLVNSYSFKDDGTPGLNYYDMRPLAQILWAADPNVDVIFVTAMPIDESMVRHVLQGHPKAEEIRKRVHFVALDDPGTDFLSQKLLDPKHAGSLEKIRGLIAGIGAPAAFFPYMGGPYEWQIARQLGIPHTVYAAHPRMIYWGSKSGGRKVFKVARRYEGNASIRVKLVDGVEDVYDAEAATLAVEKLQRLHPRLGKVVVKLNLGSSGEGNLYLKVSDWADFSHAQRRKAMEYALRGARVGIPDENGKIDTFLDVLGVEGAAVEAFIPGIERATFPSVQSEILPDGTVRILSSHEQILADGNSYLGATLSADKAYRDVIERAASEVARELYARGIVGPFGTDFAVVPVGPGRYDAYFIENNIRVTGTTHPRLVAQGLTGGVYERGALRVPDTREAIHYQSMDHDVRPNLINMDVDAFLSHFEREGARELLFDAQTRRGVVFHLLPAVKAAGNVGYTIIAGSARAVNALQKRLTQALNEMEVLYLGGGGEGRRRRFVAHDSREEVEKKIGHTSQAKLFRAFLERHPERILRRGDASGIVFHPQGYTLVAQDAAEMAVLAEAAESLLKRFSASAVAENGR